MHIGFFAYNLSGTGPRTRAKDIINGIAERTDHSVVVLTNEPEALIDEVETKRISIASPVSLIKTARSTFSKVDVVQVPINIWQVAFVRSVYLGPLIAGVGPGIQPEWYYKKFGKILGIDRKIVVHRGTNWEQEGYEIAVCTATINREHFYPYEDSRIGSLRREENLSREAEVVLYVGKLSESYGAKLVSKMAQINDDREYIVIGDGPLQDEFKNRSDIRYKGYVDNKRLPQYYNLADVTVGPRKGDNTSNVGLESIACGTPFITTADGFIREFAEDDGAYVWADRTPKDVIAKVNELLSEESFYDSQVQNGLKFIEERPLTLESAVKTHQDVYKSVIS